jgi:hypothetical protein
LGGGYGRNRAVPLVNGNQDATSTPGNAGNHVWRGRRTIIKLPEGSEITLVGQVVDHPEMVEVTWKGQSVWIFAIDFAARTEDVARPKTRAISVGAGAPKWEADIIVNVPTKTPAGTEHRTFRTTRVRRFNSAGRELF